MNKKKKNGFTLVELLAVIAILGILASVATASVINFLNGSKVKINTIAESNLKESSITYLEDNKSSSSLNRCDTFLEINDDNVKSIVNNLADYCNCVKIINVEDLKTKGFFTDDRSSCKNTKVLGYIQKSENFSEYNVYVLPGTCGENTDTSLMDKLYSSVCNDSDMDNIVAKYPNGKDSEVWSTSNYNISFGCSDETKFGCQDRVTYSIRNEEYGMTYASNIINNGKIVNYSIPYDSGKLIKNVTVDFTVFDKRENSKSFSKVVDVYLGIPTYTLSFEGNGGTSSFTTKTITYANPYGELPTATRAGYTFLGWFTQKEGGEKVTKDKIASVGNQILYAHWNVIYFSFDVNTVVGGKTYNSGLNGFKFDVYINDEKKYTDLTDFCESHPYGTKIRIVAKDATGYSLSNRDITTTLTNNIVISPTWVANKYVLSFNSAGGSSVASKSISFGEGYGNLPTPTRTYYRFDGWYTSSGSGNLVSSTTTMGAGNVTLYAHWTYLVKTAQTTMQTDYRMNGADVSGYYNTGHTIINAKFIYYSVRNASGVWTDNAPSYQGANGSSPLGCHVEFYGTTLKLVLEPYADGQCRATVSYDYLP